MNNGGVACIPGSATKISVKDRLIRNNFFIAIGIVVKFFIRIG